MKLLMLIAVLGRAIRNYFSRLLSSSSPEIKRIEAVFDPKVAHKVLSEIAQRKEVVEVLVLSNDNVNKSLSPGWEKFIYDNYQILLVGLLLVIFSLALIAVQTVPSIPEFSPRTSKKRKSRRQHSRVLQPLSGDFMNHLSSWDVLYRLQKKYQPYSQTETPLLNSFHAEFESENESYGTKLKAVTVQYNRWSDEASEVFPVFESVEQSESAEMGAKKDTLELFDISEPSIEWRESNDYFQNNNFEQKENHSQSQNFEDNFQNHSVEQKELNAQDEVQLIESFKTSDTTKPRLDTSKEMVINDTILSLTSRGSFSSFAAGKESHRTSVINVVDSGDRRKQLLQNDLASVYTLDFPMKVLLKSNTSKDPNEFFYLLGIDITLSLTSNEQKRIFESLYEMSFNTKAEILSTMKLEFDFLLHGEKFETKEFIISKLRYVLCTEYKGCDTNMMQLLQQYHTFLESSFDLLFKVLEKDRFTFTETFALICDCFSFTKVTMLLDVFIKFTHITLKRVNNNPYISDCISEYLSFCFVTLDMKSATKIFKQVCGIIKEEKQESYKKYCIILKCVQCYICFNKDEIIRELIAHPNKNKFNTCAFDFTRTFVDNLPNLLEETKTRSSSILELELFNMYQIITELFISNELIPSPIRYELLSEYVFLAFNDLRQIVQEDYKGFSPPAMIESLPLPSK